MNFASMKNYKRIAASVGLATLMTVAVAAPAFAAEPAEQEMTFEVQGGDYSIDLSALSFDDSALIYSHDGQNVGLSAPSQMTASDSTGSGEGWEVVANTTGLQVGSDGATIAAGNVKVTSDKAAAGDNTVGITGVVTPANGSALGVEGGTLVFAASAGNGDGQYTADLDVDIDIDARQATGIYSGDLVLTINAAVAD